MGNDKNIIALRPHHGMCLAFFRGEGYSEGFTGHMAQILMELQNNGNLVSLGCAADEICSACPNNCEGICVSEKNVQNYDRATLSLCGLKETEIIEFDKLTRLVQEKIIAPGHRKMICGACQWNEICETQKSRWE